MKKLLLIFVVLFAPSAWAQTGYVSATEGSAYANGSLTAELLPPTNGNVATTHTFFDLTGYVVVYGLSPGKTYGFWATKADGTAILYGRVTVTGAPQDITPFLFPIGGGSGTCNIGLTGPGGVFSVTGTPAQCNGVLNLIVSGTSGGLPCFTTATNLASSLALGLNALIKGGGPGGCVSSSTVTDDGVLPTRAPDGVNVARDFIVLEEQNANPGTAINLLACTSGTLVTLCPTNPAPGTVLGIATAGVGNSGTVQICILGRCPVFFDNQSTRGDVAVPSTTVAGEMHDTGSPAGVPGYNFFVDTANAGAGTLGIVRPPGDLASSGNSLVSCLTTLGDIWGGGAGGICTRIPAPTTLNGVFQYLGSAASAGVGTMPAYQPAGIVPRFVSGTTDTVLFTDRAVFIQYTNASPIAVTIPQMGTTGFASNFTFCAENRGAGLVTFTPTVSTVNGNATYTLAQNNSVCFISDNTNLVTKDSATSVAGTRRVCMMDVGADNGAVLANADLGPQGRQCFLPYAATIVEVTVAADGGTPNVIVGRNRAGTVANIVSAALATAAAGGLACSNVGGTPGLDGATTCSATLQNTSINQGDWLELESGTAGGTAKRMSVAVTYTVN